MSALCRRLVVLISLTAFLVANRPDCRAAACECHEARCCCCNDDGEAAVLTGIEPRHDHGSDCPCCPCRGGCAFCNVAKVPGNPVNDPLPRVEQPLVQRVAELVLSYSAPLVSTLTPPPRS